MKINLKLNEIKLIPYQYKRLLNKDKSSVRPLLTVKNTFFFAFCVIEEFYIVVHGDDANLRIIKFYVFICYE